VIVNNALRTVGLRTKAKRLAPGEVVTVTRIDRSTFDLFAIVKQIVDAKAQFRSLAEPCADTDTSTGRSFSPEPPPPPG
jgi:DNA invertase Pin-like site-specific DNA recombinase